ncbi:UxaA family hydrolase [Caulobacter sp. BP25]|uniref:UxaA family hydrolase n=1 Tax=Caulobacter sp. BP25 TaxID=2048900 RepID=UPI000C12DE1C|nr:UxaA family hydrolase [Caulobacter sp. BP25]PHY19964.1 altronate hydrolase [Caulobacter sp. BP25]
MSMVLLHPDDNILVLAAPIRAGQTLQINGQSIVAASDVAVGHKIARRALSIGEKVLKYGAPIGSMTAPAEPAEHVHMHNMKSDYIASHTRQATGEDPA